MGNWLLLPILHRTWSQKKAIIKNTDMSVEMQEDAIDCASRALNMNSKLKDINAFIAKEFDQKYGRTWHLISDVGREIYYCIPGCQHQIYFYLGPVGILLFKTKKVRRKRHVNFPVKNVPMV